MLSDVAEFAKGELFLAFIQILSFPAVAFSVAAYEHIHERYPLVLLCVITSSYLLLAGFFLMVYQLKSGALYLHVGEIFIFYVFQNPVYLHVCTLAWATGLSIVYFILVKLFSILCQSPLLQGFLKSWNLDRFILN